MSDTDTTRDYATMLAGLKKQIKHACIHNKPVVNSSELILERIIKLFSALELEVSRDAWTPQNHRLINHIKSVVWQLDDDDAEALEDALNFYI